ncbi:MAG: glycosyltransferase family 39 protein [Anaerolineae bacterium]|nr:glycosyltransferase family 39 protein [Anaerolineae bacterium]
MSRLNPVFIAVLVFLSAALPRLLIVAQPIPTQLDKALPDDAYYYFLTARNIVSGRGASIDGLNPSNGWHPLWMIVNTAVFSSIDGDPNMPVRAALALGALCDCLVAVCIYWGLRWLRSESAGVIGGLAYAINIMPILQSVNGLETGLAALMLALAWLWTLHLLRAPRIQTALLWGAIYGFAFLARTDSALVLACLGIYTAWRLRHSLQWVIVGAVVAVVIVAPWLIWNQVNFGSAFDQVSSSAVPWTARARLAGQQPSLPTYVEGLRVLVYPAYWIRGDYLGAPPIIGFLLWFLGGWCIFNALRTADQTARELARIVLVLLAGGALLVLVHTVIRWYPRPWYFVITAQSLALALGLFWNAIRRTSVRLTSLGVSLAGMALTGVMVWEIGLYPWQSGHQYTAALWARDNLPAGTRLASMNSGVIGYYSGLDTVNMDGVVNPQAFAAIQGYRMLDYMQAIGVDYLLDSDNAVRNEYALFMGDGYPDQLPETKILTEEYPGLGFLRLYRVEPKPGD